MTETLEELQSRHSDEKKELEAKITAKKKSATKKSRKGVNSECDDLEVSLRLRHEEEIAALASDVNVADLNPEKDDVLTSETGLPTPQNEPMETLTTSFTAAKLNGPDTAEDDTSESPYAPGKKRNRQKERLARRAAEQEAAALEAEQEAAKMPNWKRQERTGMLKAFAEHGLVEQEIRPDGHCLFSAFADQLVQLGIPLSTNHENVTPQDAVQGYKATRKAAADYIEGHADDFAGFMEEHIGVYTYKIRDTATWGGHLEVTALARHYGVLVKVVQNERIDTFEPTAGAKEPMEVWLAYYLHGYGLGEHYNSLRKKL